MISKRQYLELCDFEGFAYELKIISENSNDDRMSALCKQLFDTVYELRNYTKEEMLNESTSSER